MVKCSKFCSESLHGDTDCSNVVTFFRREIGKKNKISAASQTVATRHIALKICQPHFISHCSRFHPNRCTFGGVRAECVKAVLLTHRAF